MYPSIKLFLQETDGSGYIRNSFLHSNLFWYILDVELFYANKKFMLTVMSKVISRDSGVHKIGFKHSCILDSPL